MSNVTVTVEIEEVIVATRCGWMCILFPVASINHLDKCMRSVLKRNSL